jgi:hypothetical protein
MKNDILALLVVPLLVILITLGLGLSFGLAFLTDANYKKISSNDEVFYCRNIQYDSSMIILSDCKDGKIRALSPPITIDR